MNRILLVDDAKDIHLVVSRILNDERNALYVAASAKEALQLIHAEKIDLILLDIELPDGDGFELCSQFQNDPKTRDIPVVFLTGSESPSSRMTAYSLGADDFIKKPIIPAELKIIVDSKIQKLKRRAAQSEDLFIEPFRFHLASQRVWSTVDHSQIDLTPREFKLLYYLVKNSMNVLSRAQILDEVWGQNANVVDRTIDTHIYVLRKKLKTLAGHIESVPGVGYRFMQQRKDARKSAA